MDLNNDQKELVALFMKQEFLIGKLYKLFSYRYPEYHEFWTEMATEEHLHASWIKRLTERDSTDKFKFSQGDVRSTALASSIESLEGLISGVKKNIKLTIEQAVSMALHLEKALWEKKFFQCIEGDSDDVRRIMSMLHSEQEVHIIKIDKFALQIQKKQ